MVRITNGKGFQMTFANGWTVSVQWGVGNYADHYNTTWHVDADGVCGVTGSATAEIAAWDVEGTWYDFGGDTVKGYVSMDEIAAFIHKVSNFA